MGRGPSGTVTFLFTDVEGSTVLWDVAPVAMGGALARHDEIVLDVVAAHGGFVFSSGGDGFGVAFGSAPSATRAAAAMQAALAAEGWPPDALIRVRIGLHSGTAEERNGNYYGATVSRAARVASLGRGGQIVVSASTAALLVDEGWTLVDVGVHRLEGLVRAERLYRLVLPGAIDVDGPLRGVRQAGNLPRARGALIGRDRDVAALAGTLVPGSLTSVIGVGGVGKTRVALAAADLVGDRFADGCWLVELAAVVSQADVPSAIATALGIRLLRGGDVLDGLVDALANQQRLVVLDNCEHLLDAVVDVVQRIAERCPDVAVVTTTREALGTPDERVTPLRPLPTVGAAAASDAALLFCERARAALGEFEPDHAALVLVERISRRLDGLPLAIELAAARLPTMTLDELDARLDARFSVLTRRRGAIERHQSLRTTVAWSYDHLDDDERLVFDCLSAFVGDFDLDAAKAVIDRASVHQDIEEVITSLTAKSMLSVERVRSGTRFQLLETLRQWGEERLEQRGLARTVHQRHLSHYVAWSSIADEGVRGLEEVRWHHAFETEWHNLRSALRWAYDAGAADDAGRLLRNVLWWAGIRLRLEVDDWIGLVLSMPAAADHPVRPRALAVAGLIADIRGDNDRAMALLAEAAGEEVRLALEEPWVPMITAAVPRDLHDKLDSALQVQTRSEHPFFRHVGLAQEATLRALLLAVTPGDADAELELQRIREIVRATEAFGNPGLRSHATMALGLALAPHDPHAAIVHLERALELALAVDIEYSTMQTRNHLAETYSRVGRHLDALALIAPAVERHIRAGTEGFAWYAVGATIPPLVGMGEVLLATNVLNAIVGRGPLPPELQHLDSVVRAARTPAAPGPATAPPMTLAEVLHQLRAIIDRRSGA